MRIKSRPFSGVAVLVAIAVGVMVIAVGRSVGPFHRPRVTTTPASEPQQPRPTSEISPAAAADQAKPVYAGPLGDFLVTPHEVSDFPPCPKPYRPAKNYKSSELYSPVFGDLEGLSECADGKMISISVYGREAIGKRYFVGPAKVPYTVPRDRLVLLTVAGHSAIEQVPLPGSPGNLHLTAIQRFPSGDKPGIIVWIDNTDKSVEEAAALAAQIMGVRP